MRKRTVRGNLSSEKSISRQDRSLSTYSNNWLRTAAARQLSIMIPSKGYYDKIHLRIPCDFRIKFFKEFHLYTILNAMVVSGFDPLYPDAFSLLRLR